MNAACGHSYLLDGETCFRVVEEIMKHSVINVLKPLKIQRFQGFSCFMGNPENAHFNLWLNYVFKLPSTVIVPWLKGKLL
jgi:hypothetical protein